MMLLEFAHTLYARDLPNQAPADPRTKADNVPSLLFSWWVTGCVLVIVLFRVVGRMVRNNMLFREDKIILWSLIPLFIRMGLVHCILIWGTNNALLTNPSEDEIYHRSIGARLVLVSRIFYAMFIWMTKWTISEFLKRLTRSFWRSSYEIVLRGIRIFLIATFIAVVISTLGECQPFDHYWQVVPDPGPACRQGWAQLITMGSADIITDLTLVIFPAVIVIRSQFTLKRKIALVLLFSLSLIPLFISAYRIPAVISHRALQQYRTVWASGEILAAAAVANAVVLGSFLRDRGVKKARYRPHRTHSTSDSVSRVSASASIRRNTAPVAGMAQPLDSDEDLFRGMCYRPNGDEAVVVKPEMAMMSGANPSPKQKTKPNFKLPDFNTTGDDDSDDTLTGSRHNREDHPNDPLPSPGDIRGQRRVSFFDIGGLLENGDVSSRASTLAPSSPISLTSVQDFASAAGSRRPSLRPNWENTLSTIQSTRQTPEPGSDPTSPPQSPSAPPKTILRRRQSSERGLRSPGWSTPANNDEGAGLALGDAGGLIGSPANGQSRRSSASAAVHNQNLQMTRVTSNRPRPHPSDALPDFITSAL